MLCSSRFVSQIVASNKERKKQFPIYEKISSELFLLLTAGEIPMRGHHSSHATGRPQYFFRKEVQSGGLSAQVSFCATVCALNTVGNWGNS